MEKRLCSPAVDFKMKEGQVIFQFLNSKGNITILKSGVCKLLTVCSKGREGIKKNLWVGSLLTSVKILFYIAAAIDHVSHGKDCSKVCT